jgi:hypothetical protein
MGWKYRFRKTLQLLPGKHRISIAVPLADVVVEKEVVLKEGINLFHLTPIYNTSIISRPAHYSWYSKGLHSVVIELNGETL